MTIKVLVVDDSFFMRKMISEILNADPNIEVIDTANNGLEALTKLKTSSPDVITLDLEMPKLPGLSTLHEIMKVKPTPVVMVSAHTKEGAKITLDCLSSGAVSVVLKPSGEVSWNIEKVKQELLDKIHDAAQVSITKLKSLIKRKPIKQRISPHLVTTDKVVAIGSSTGGPKALELLLPELPFNFPASIIIVQHLPPKFTASLATRLDSLCDIAVKEAQDNDIIEAGKVYVAPGGFHTVIQRKSIKGIRRHIISLNKKPPVKHLRPSIDVMMNSVAETYGKNVIGVILTGMGTDGSDGMKLIKSKQGTTIVQDKTTSLIFGMPKRVVEQGNADFILPLSKISKKILELLA